MKPSSTSTHFWPADFTPPQEAIKDSAHTTTHIQSPGKVWGCIDGATQWGIPNLPLLPGKGQKEKPFLQISCKQASGNNHSISLESVFFSNLNDSKII